MQNLTSSFRDPSGYLFTHNGSLYRSVNGNYQAQYDLLMSSGLYDRLTDQGLLVSHEEVDPGVDADAYKTLQPDFIPYISYPYEWSFNQLKDAALTTLIVHREAVHHGMSLKDASAYNIQFLKGKPIFIDTLSFDVYEEGQPWVAYKQFCQHFLAPLALISHCDFRITQLLKSNIDGIPLDLTGKLLPRRTWLKYSLLAHIHLHAMTQKRYDDVGRQDENPKTVNMGKAQFLGLIDSLENAVHSLHWEYKTTEWGNYYEDTNYDELAMTHKIELVSEFLRDTTSRNEQVAADYGANTGRFSRLAASEGYLTLSFDIDEVAVDKNYLQVKQSNEDKILPLILDLSNPSPGLGWMHEERDSWVYRQHVDVGIALAIIHHLAISNNIPLGSIAAFFAKCCKRLILEFVPKVDSQVKRLLATRKDIFANYDEAGFESAFTMYFSILRSEKVNGSERTIYLLERK